MRSSGYMLFVALFLTYLVHAGFAQDAGVPSANVVAPLPQMDTYRISAGQSEGFQVGDRVRIQHGDKPLCEAVIFTLAPHSAVICVMGSSAKLSRGDRVVFLRHNANVGGASYVPKVTELGDDNGTPVDYKSKIVPGRFNFFYFYCHGHKKCEEIEPFFRKWLQTARTDPDSVIFIVNVGSQESRCVAMLPFKSFPCMLVYNRHGGLIALNPGHSTYEILKNPNYMSAMRDREQKGVWVTEPSP